MAFETAVVVPDVSVAVTEKLIFCPSYPVVENVVPVDPVDVPLDNQEYA
jgi:hypothetical protein